MKILMIDVGGTEVHLQIPDHVEQDETHHRDPADGHHIFLAHSRGIEVGKKPAAAASCNRRTAYRDSAGGNGLGHREPTSR